MRYKKINDKIQPIIRFLDNYLATRGNFPHKKIVRKKIIELFPEAQFLGKGWFKSTYLIKSGKKFLVLKAGKKRYTKIPETKRNRDQAKIYWFDNYFELQKLAEPPKGREEELEKLKQKLKKYGFIDVKLDNCGVINNRLKVFDANLKGWDKNNKKVIKNEENIGNNKEMERPYGI
jgi:hypothetical protein